MAAELVAYEPLDLSPYCNAGLEVLGDGGGDTPTAAYHARVAVPRGTCGRRGCFVPDDPGRAGHGAGRQVSAADHLRSPSSLPRRPLVTASGQSSRTIVSTSTAARPWRCRFANDSRSRSSTTSGVKDPSGLSRTGMTAP